MSDPQLSLFGTQDEDPEVIETLQDIADLELALDMEVQRLRRLHLGGAPISRKPAWWWRAMLVSWVHSPSTRRAHPEGLVRGLAFALRTFTDSQLATYLTTVGTALQSSA